MMKTLFLQPPSFDGFDGGAGSRYQAKREIKSFWFPTRLAQPAALVPGSRLIDAPPAKIGMDVVLADSTAQRDARAPFRDYLLNQQPVSLVLAVVAAFVGCVLLREGEGGDDEDGRLPPRCGGGAPAAAAPPTEQAARFARGEKRRVAPQ
jgi:hypothetical protein